MIIAYLNLNNYNTSLLMLGLQDKVILLLYFWKLFYMCVSKNPLKFILKSILQIYFFITGLLCFWKKWISGASNSGNPFFRLFSTGQGPGFRMYALAEPPKRTYAIHMTYVVIGSFSREIQIISTTEIWILRSKLFVFHM